MRTTNLYAGFHLVTLWRADLLVLFRTLYRESVLQKQSCEQHDRKSQLVYGEVLKESTYLHFAGQVHHERNMVFS